MMKQFTLSSLLHSLDLLACLIHCMFVGMSRKGAQLHTKPTVY